MAKEATKPQTDQANDVQARDGIPSNKAGEFPNATQRTLRGVVLNIPVTVRPGDTISYDDALFYNVARAGYIHSAFTDYQKNRKDEKGDPIPFPEGDALIAAFNEYAANWTYQPRGEGASVDPVVAEMRKIARNEITVGLKQKGRTLIGSTKDVWDAAIEKYLEKHGDRVRKTAEKNLKTAGDAITEDFLASIESREVGQAQA